jgi:hypothetical protein
MNPETEHACDAEQRSKPRSSVAHSISLLREWRQWVRQCSVGPEKARTNSSAHEVVSNCDVYLQVIEEEWQRVGSRERLSASPPRR